MENEIGSRILNKRNSLGLTQSQLSDLTGISVPTISNIEGNKRLPSIDSIILIAKVLKTSTDYLLLGDSQKEYSSIKEETLEHKILSSVKQLIINNVLYPQCSLDWEGKCSQDDTLEFTRKYPKEIILHFSLDIQKLIEIKDSASFTDAQLEIMIENIISTYEEKLKKYGNEYKH